MTDNNDFAAYFCLLFSIVWAELSAILTYRLSSLFTAQKMKFSINDFLSKCDQIRSFLRIWSHLLKKPVMEILIFCEVF